MKTAVFHLVREPGESEDFLASYFEHLSGADHELFPVLKGGASAPVPGFRQFRVNDFGRSLHAFGKALRRVDLEGFDTVCFLNSFSRIACDGWLDRLVSTARRPEVGMAGCTASLESFLGNKPALWRSLLFPPWPNPHLRTNAICLRMEVARKYWPRFAFNKPLEHVSESGWWGLTNRLRVAGLDCVVVNATSEHTLSADRQSFESPCFREGWPTMVTDNRRKGTCE